MATEKTHSGNLNRSKVDAQPNAGARQMAGKTNECDSVIKDAKKYVVAAVTTVNRDANKGTAKRLASALPDNNPKKRVE